MTDSSVKNGEKRIKWYLRPVSVVIAILALGPLAIPLVWISPAFKKWVKAALTVLLLLLTIWMADVSMKLYETLKADIQSLENTLKQ